MATGSKNPDNLVLMGRIGAAHGIRGEVRIQSFTEDPTALPAYSPFTTDKPGQSLTITSARLSKNVIVAKLKDIADRNAAEALNGTNLFVPRDRLPVVEDEDDFYITDLIGLEARLQDGTVLGTIRAVPNYGADDLLEITLQSGKSELYPFTRDVVPEIRIAEGYLIVIPPNEVIVEGEQE